ncbi:hypothetical protein LCGC14_0489830 [marine sediment metagenome]|uniref:PEP-CTERM protein-sorting domain-containing protein n=1 Tax=marine sediment metagenome TaxID=412755 RepID=A0A0F9UTU1_9ZZZZ|nr:hypothetical protein [Phycisphaerae bacterium]HDZ43598.1 hypothetical protein [Phycisphaerae bacterium]
MLGKPNRLKSLLTIAATMVLIIGGATHAGPLNGHASAYFDGVTTWAGSTAFDSLTGVAGYVDWAVFGLGNFPFGDTGYTPPPDELVYAYQVFSTGTDSISAFQASLDNLANTVGSFTGLAGDATIATWLLPLKAEWQFAGITTGYNSEGLAFSSPKKPKEMFGIVVDGGAFAVVNPVPGPSGADVLEPMTLSLLAGGSVTLLLRGRRKRR